MNLFEQEGKETCPTCGGSGVVSKHVFERLASADGPKARTGDPMTSKMAALQNLPRRRNQHRRLIEVYGLHESMSQEEACLFAGIRLNSGTSRISELVRAGWIEPTGDQRLSSADAKVDVYRMTAWGRSGWRRPVMTDLTFDEQVTSTFEAMDELPVGHLSASAVSTFLRCPEMYRQKYVVKPKYPRRIGSQAVIGTAFHVARRRMLERRMKDMAHGREELADLYADAWKVCVNSEQIEWGKEDPNAMFDVGWRMLVAYAIDGPGKDVQPLYVERKFVMHVDGVPVPLLGYLDVVTLGETVIDTKTAKSATKQPQSGWYVAALVYMLATKMPFEWHTISRPTQKGGPGVFTPENAPTLRVAPTPARLEIAVDLIRQASDGIRHLMTTKGPWQMWPAHGLASGECRWCDFWRDCRWPSK